MERWMKRLTRLACQLFLGKAGKVPFDIGRVHKVLILRNDKIGDMIVSTPLFRELKKAHPGIVIDVVASSVNRQIIAANPHVDDIIVWDKRGALNDAAVIRSIRRRRYDVIFNTQNIFSFAFLLRMKLLGARHLFGFNVAKYGTSTAQLGMFDYTVDCVRSAPILDSYFSALAPFALTGIDHRYELFGVDAHATRALEFLVPLRPLYRGFICFNYQGSHATRTLHDDDIQALCVALAERYPSRAVVLIHPPGGREHARAMVDAVARTNVVLAVETANVLELAALIKECELVLSPDTAVIHLASAYNKKIVGFYINTDNYRWFYPASDQDHYRVQLAPRQEIGRIDIAATMADVDVLLAIRS